MLLAVLVLLPLARAPLRDGVGKPTAHLLCAHCILAEALLPVQGLLLFGSCRALDLLAFLAPPLQVAPLDVLLKSSDPLDFDLSGHAPLLFSCIVLGLATALVGETGLAHTLLRGLRPRRAGVCGRASQDLPLAAAKECRRGVADATAEQIVLVVQTPVQLRSAR